MTQETGARVVELAALIRRVDGDHDLGAGELAERIIEGGYRLPDGGDRPEDNGARALAADVRKAITDVYYDARNDGQTMETAADRARDAVMAVLPAAAELDRLRGFVQDVIDWADVPEDLRRHARAALAPEGSAGTRTVWPRWECSTCRKTAVSCSTYRCCPDCDHDPIRATEGSARDGG